MPHEPTRPEEFELLADLTSMLTLGLHEDWDALEQYVAAMADDPERVRSLLVSGMILYSQAFSQLGDQQGFDALAVTRRVAIREARERWGLTTID